MIHRRRLTLIEILQPRRFKPTPERARATRTVVQPEIDAFEAQEMLREKSAPAGRRRGEAIIPL